MEEIQNQPTKRNRLRSVRSQLHKCINQLDQIAEDETQKPAKRSDAVLAKTDLLARIYSTDSEERKSRLKFADVERLQAELSNLRAENRRLTAQTQELKARPEIPESFEEKLARLTGDGRTNQTIKPIKVTLSG